MRRQNSHGIDRGHSDGCGGGSGTISRAKKVFVLIKNVKIRLKVCTDGWRPISDWQKVIWTKRLAVVGGTRREKVSYLFFVTLFKRDPFILFTMTGSHSEHDRIGSDQCKAHSLNKCSKWNGNDCIKFGPTKMKCLTRISCNRFWICFLFLEFEFFTVRLPKWSVQIPTNLSNQNGCARFAFFVSLYQR